MAAEASTRRSDELDTLDPQPSPSGIGGGFPLYLRGERDAVSTNTVQLELHGCSLLACPVPVGGSPSRIGGCRIWCRLVC